MKRFSVFALAVAAFLAIVAFGAMGTPGSSFHARLTSFVSAGPDNEHAYSATGPIHAAGNTHYCLTATPHPINGSRVYTAPCIKGDTWQYWYSWKIVPGNTGGINLAAYPDDVLCQLGRIAGVKQDWKVKTCNNAMDSNGYIVGYTNYQKGELISRVFPFVSWPFIQTRYVTAPEHISGNQQSYWNKASSDKTAQEWIFPKWEELAPEPSGHSVSVVG